VFVTTGLHYRISTRILNKHHIFCAPCPVRRVSCKSFNGIRWTQEDLMVYNFIVFKRGPDFSLNHQAVNPG
jgi:hypothetical protein